MECVGECNKEGTCKGEVRLFQVSGNGFTKPFSFCYCETAVKEDQERGFLVEPEYNDSESYNADEQPSKVQANITQKKNK